MHPSKPEGKGWATFWLPSYNKLDLFPNGGFEQKINQSCYTWPCEWKLTTCMLVQCSQNPLWGFFTTPSPWPTSWNIKALLSCFWLQPHILCSCPYFLSWNPWNQLLWGTKLPYENPTLQIKCFALKNMTGKGTSKLQCSEFYHEIEETFEWSIIKTYAPWMLFNFHLINTLQRFQDLCSTHIWAHFLLQLKCFIKSLLRILLGSPEILTQSLWV